MFKNFKINKTKASDLEPYNTVMIDELVLNMIKSDDFSISDQLDFFIDNICEDDHITSDFICNLIPRIYQDPKYYDKIMKIMIEISYIPSIIPKILNIKRIIEILGESIDSGDERPVLCLGNMIVHSENVHRIALANSVYPKLYPYNDPHILSIKAWYLSLLVSRFSEYDITNIIDFVLKLLKCPYDHIKEQCLSGILFYLSWESKNILVNVEVMKHIPIFLKSNHKKLIKKALRILLALSDWIIPEEYIDLFDLLEYSLSSDDYSVISLTINVISKLFPNSFSIFFENQDLFQNSEFKLKAYFIELLSSCKDFSKLTYESHMTLYQIYKLNYGQWSETAKSILLLSPFQNVIELSQN